MAYSYEQDKTTFDTAELEAMGYPPEVAVDHPANVDTVWYESVYVEPLTTKSLRAQGYPLPAAQNHPANEDASEYCLPTTDQLVKIGYPRTTAEQSPYNRDRGVVRRHYAGQLAAERRRSRR